MPVKTVLYSHVQPKSLVCKVDMLSLKKSTVKQKDTSSIYADDVRDLLHDELYKTFAINKTQVGASSLLMALFAAAVLVTTSVGLIFGHKLGYQSGYHALQAESEEIAASGQLTVEELNELRSSQKVMSNQIATAKQELTISLNNLDELRENQQELSIENKQLNQLNELYAEIVSENGGLPLQILGTKIQPLPENAFEYAFDVGMLSEDGNAKRLNASLTLLNDDDFVEVPLDSERYTISGIERIRGRFSMPTGFKPLQVKVVLESNGQEVEQLYNWQLGAMVDNMPISLVDLPEVDQSPVEP